MTGASTSWEGLKSYALSRCPTGIRAELVRLVADLDMLMDSGTEFPLSVESDTYNGTLGHTGGRLRLTAHVNHVIYRYEEPRYRHTNASGRKSQTRSVYLDDAVWDLVCAEGDPSEVMRRAIEAWVHRRKR
jgi:hypothetical protein